MAEFKISRFRYTWKGDWNTSTAYIKDDIVKYGGGSWVCIRQHSASTFVADQTYTPQGETNAIPAWVKMTDGFAWKDEWVSSTLFDVGDIVLRSGVVYLCVESHTSSSNFDTDADNWTEYASADRWNSDWNQTSRYGVGDVVKYNGIVYRCIIEHTSSTILEDDLENWQTYNEGIQYAGTWSEFTDISETVSSSYRKNDLVKYGGSVWRCIQTHTVGSDSTLNFQSEEYWTIEIPGEQSSGVWNSTTDYQVGDVVKHGGNVFYSLSVNYNSPPGLSIYQTIDREDPVDWVVITKGVRVRGDWSAGTTDVDGTFVPTLYKTGDVVRRGGYIYVALLDTTADGSTLDYLDATNWEVVIPGQAWKNTWKPSAEATATDDAVVIDYAVGDVVTFHGTAYVCTVSHTSTLDTFPGDNGAGFNNWDILLLAGDRNVGMTTRGDLLTYDLTRGSTGDGSSFGETNVPIGTLDQLVVANDQGGVSYKTWGNTDYLVYVAPHGVDDETDPDRGFNYFKPWKTIRFACERIEETGLNINAFVKVKIWGGVYEEILPIIVPAKVAVQGDEVRTVTVKPNGPISELSLDSSYTIAVLSRLSGFIRDILLGNETSPTIGNTEVQVLPATESEASTSAIADNVETLIGNIVDYINFYINSSGTLPTVTSRNQISSAEMVSGRLYQIISVGTTNFKDLGSTSNTVGTLFVATGGSGNGVVVETTFEAVAAVALLENNKEYLAAEAIAYMQQVYPLYNFNSDLCKRDVRRYIDAWKYDIVHTGNYRTILAARYYRNAVLGSSGEDMFYVRDATGVRNMTLTGLTGTLNPTGVFDLYQKPTGGSYVSLDPGWGPDDDRTWINTRSPYIQNCCTFGYAAVGQKIDGSLHNGGNKSIVSNDFTQIISDGIGAWVTNGGRAELVSVFTYYSQVGYLAEDGGIIRATNGNNSYGTIGAMSVGIDADEVPRTATVNTRNNQATVAAAFAGEVNDEVLILEFANCGQNYKSLSYSIIGSGINAEVVADEFRDDGVFESLKIRLDDSGIPGGGGYTFAENNAQGGNSTQIVLAASDANEEAEYLGLRITIVSGPGTGQYGYISAYNIVTKYVTVRRESNDELGWDHVISGYPILDTLLPATRYRIEPRPIFSAPPYSATEIDTAISTDWTDITYGETTDTYLNVLGSAGEGVVVTDDGLTTVVATWNITKTGRTYTVALSNPGAGYVDGQTVTILGTALGGTSPENDIVITISNTTNDSTNSIVSFSYSGVTTSGKFVATSGSGTAALYSVDGNSWTTTAMPSAGNWKSVAAGNNMFVALKYGSANAASSNDGITWIARTLPASRNWNSVTYGGNKFVAVSGDSNSAAYSTNGTTWTSASMPVFGDSSSNEWVDVCYGKNKFVAIANSGNAVAYSSDGITWTGTFNDPVGDSTQHDWVSIAYGNNRFVILSSTGQISYTFDLVNWYSATMPTQDGSTSHNWKKIAYAQGVFFAVGDTGSRDIAADPTTGPTTFSATSPDGILWTPRVLDTLQSWGGIAFGNPDVTLDDSSLGNNKGMWIAIPGETSPYFNKIQTGATTNGRVVIETGRVSSIRIWEPGSGYLTPPTLTLVDPNNTSDLAVENRLGDGVIANPSWINRGLGYRTSTTVITVVGDGFADEIPLTKFITLSNLELIPKLGSQLLFGTNSQVFNTVRVTDLGYIEGSGLTAYLQISPVPTVDDYLEHGTDVAIRERFSQCRITGHDFLDIGTGNFVETNYPEIYSTGLYETQPFNEILESEGGRVFYTSTDQSGNFRTGELFAVEQATGIVTISADFFDLSGLTELKLGGVRLGGTGVVIREFSTDPLFSEDSNNVVPTQRAIKAYLNNKLSVSGADLVGAAFTAGQIKVGPTGITNVLGLTIQIPASQALNFAGDKANISGFILAQSMFYRSFKDE